MTSKEPYYTPEPQPAYVPKPITVQAVKSQARGLGTIAIMVMVLDVTAMIGSVIAGWVIAATTNIDEDTTTYPNLGVGIGIIAVGLFWTTVVLMFAQWARVVASSTELATS